MTKPRASRLKRPRHPMPTFVRSALVRNKLIRAYRRRPPYQQNDYLGWITRAKLEPTRQRRLAQMLEELARGDRYMKMVYRSKRSDTSQAGPSSAEIRSREPGKQDVCRKGPDRPKRDSIRQMGQ